MVSGFERRALHGVRVHGRERGVVEVAGPHADHALGWLDEDLAVTHFSGARGSEDGLDARLDERLRAHHLDLDLLVELHEDGRAAVLTHGLLVAPMAGHAPGR